MQSRDDLLKIIERLPARAPGVAKSQKQNWVSWLTGHDEHPRIDPNRNARTIYNALNNPNYIIWLAAAAGVAPSRIRRAAEDISEVVGEGRRAAAARRALPWNIVADKLDVLAGSEGNASERVPALQPTQKLLVIDLLREAGFNVDHWADYGGKHAASNPKSYNWSFEQVGEQIALCLWYDSIFSSGGEIYHQRIPSTRPRDQERSSNINHRARAVQKHVRAAYEQQLPIRVIVVDRDEPRSNSSRKAIAPRVSARMLDPKSWAVTEYDYDTGGWLLTRGAEPVTPATSTPDAELSFFEGAERRRFILHRRREARARREKIAQVLATHGKLVCEVPKCNFDFAERYGPAGAGFAQVHHLSPLKLAPKEGRTVSLKDLAVVCANCHAMIHLGGRCRELARLIP